jgi:hypothetical protein
MSERIYYRAPVVGTIADIAKADPVRAACRARLDSEAERSKCVAGCRSNEQLLIAALSCKTAVFVFVCCLVSAAHRTVKQSHQMPAAPHARTRCRYDHYLQSNLRQRTQLDPKGRPPTTTTSLWTIGRVQAHDEVTGIVKVEVTAESGPHPRGKLLDLKAEDTNVCVIFSRSAAPHQQPLQVAAAGDPPVAPTRRSLPPPLAHACIHPCWESRHNTGTTRRTRT